MVADERLERHVPKTVLDELTRLAWERHRDVTPCGYKRSLKSCVIHYDNKWMLFYNAKDGSTHAVHVDD